MARENRMQSGTQNPAVKFFQWKSEHQKFCYYDKVNQENVFVDMPFQFLAMANYKTVKGWNQKREGAIIANEVKSLKDELIVKFYKKGEDVQEIARGPWNDIKDKVDSWSGRYTESVYVMLPDGEVANIQLSGASLSTWFDFQKNQQDRFFDNWVFVKGFKEGKQGAVTYTYPVFEWGTSLNAEFQLKADLADEKIQAYEESYFGKKEEVQEPARQRSEVDKYEMNANKAPVPPSKVDAEIAMLDDLNDYDPDLGF